MHLLLWGGILALCTLVAFVLGQSGKLGAISAPFDFRAFYCGGRAVLAHADPYHVEPLRSCEIGTLTAGLHWIPGLAVPSPVPPYTVPLFALLGALPFPVAAALWVGLAVTAWLRMIELLRGLTGLDIFRLVAGTVGLGLVCSLIYGQLVPLTLWLVVEAAVALRAGDDRRAAIFAILTTIEPQIGGPVCLALFVLRPMTRRTLALGVAALLAVSLAALRPAGCLEWLTAVLPAQANSELRDPYQFSLTSALVLGGVAPNVAHVLGIGDYAAMVLLGIWGARRLEARWRDAAVIALLPPVFVVFGGPYVHEHHLAAALPMGLLAFARTRRPEFVIALALLSGPWFTVIVNTDLPQVRDAFWATHVPVIPAVRPTDLPEITWESYLSAYVPRPSAVLFAALVKVPQWLGVALVALPLLGLPAPKRGAVGLVPEAVSA